MRFEIRYPSGAHHEVELSGTLAVLGRDPSSDLVLNDPKCSRRHAVIEAGPDGLAIRDAGSANGIYVNGKKAERARIQDGDEIRLGDVVIRVLPEDVPGTLVMAPEEMDDSTRPSRIAHPAPAAAPPRPPAPPAPLRAAPPLQPPPQPPAPQPPVHAHVAPPRMPQPAAPPLPPYPVAPPAPNKKGGGSTMLIVGALGCLALLLLTVIGIVGVYFFLQARAKTSDAACVERLRLVATAEDAFRSGTCGSYADMEGLTNPAAVIPRYPASAPPFLTREQSTSDANGCRFELTVTDPVAPSIGCPSRSFRRYAVAATPVAGRGRYMRIGNDGVIHVADGRPATDDDPALPATQ